MVMPEIETGITINVYADPDYGYAVHVGSELYVSYISYLKDEGDQDGPPITFGSKAEMEAVAKAMLKACSI
jgi:hypothetical protein